MKILKAIAKIVLMTIVFPFAVVTNFIGLRLWRVRYKKMQEDARDRFDEIPTDFR